MIRHFWVFVYTHTHYICTFFASCVLLLYCTSTPKSATVPTYAANPEPNVPFMISESEETSPEDEIIDNTVTENTETQQTETQPEKTVHIASVVEPTHTKIIEQNMEYTRYSHMTDEERIAQLLIIRINIPSLHDEAEFTKIYTLIRDIKPGGVILFNNSLESNEDLQTFIRTLQQHSIIPLFVSADVEGGAVNRFRNIDDSLLATIPSPRNMAIEYTPQELKKYAFQIGKKLSALGINMNLAPVADIRSSHTPAFLVERTFADTPEETALYTNAYISGIQSANVMAVIKHFPGHGSATGDPHFLQVKVQHSEEEVHNKDMLPFRYAIEHNVSSVMLGHMIVSAIDADNSASASEKIISILKNELHFNGLIMTDSLKMKGIASNTIHANIEATMINAGVDILLAPAQPRRLIKNLLTDLHNNILARRRIKESVIKILTYKNNLQ